MFLKLFCIFCAIHCLAYCDDNVPFVSTKLGKIQGIYETSYGGKIYSAFYGIPYAKPPVGDLRFQEPQPIREWLGIWNASISSIQCVQVLHTPEPEGGRYLGDEDCLYLNVFVPKRESTDKSKLLDVIVHIHGGGLMFASGNDYAGPKYLMDKDVVFVTFNYRLGIMGFLSTEDEIVPGNNGMKDQAMALKWIKDHIVDFGGNPNSITITGLSAGGASVHFHYLSPLSRGLFTRGVSFSGNALIPWVLQEQPLQKARMIGAQLGCTDSKTEKLIMCMKQRSTRQIVEAIRLLRVWLFNPFSPLGVVVEKKGNNKFLPEHPYVLLKEGKFYDVPWITSLTSEEGFYPGADYVVKDSFLPHLEENWLQLAPYVLDYNYTISSDIKDEISNKIKKEYLNDQPISSTTYKTLIHMMGDRLFAISGEKAAKLQAHMAKSSVYFYYFSFIGDEMESFATYFANQDYPDGVSHGDDTMYIFSQPHKTEMPMKKLTDADEQIKDILLDMLTSYSATNSPVMGTSEWLPLSKDLNDPLMQLHIKSPKDIAMEDSAKINRHRAMWESIPFAENENLFPTIEKDEL